QLADHLTSPDYWTQHIRHTVRFTTAIHTLADHGVTTFVELGPDPVLTTLTQTTLHDTLAINTLRQGHPETRTTTAALATLHTHGHPVTWPHLDGTATNPADLPTYPFQRERYWLHPTPSTASRSAGPASGGHPLLDIAIELPDGGHLFTSALALQRHTWLDGHAVLGVPVLPGAAFADIALKLGDRLGLGRLDDLALEHPLVLPERGEVEFQVLVGPADESGARPIGFRSRPNPTDHEAAQEWVGNASGRLAVSAPSAAAPRPQVWPPAGAEPVPVEPLYAQVAAAGVDYGPLFHGLRAVWRHGTDLYAEVALPEDTATDGFALHPALLDAALHPLLVWSGADDGLRLPFAWQGVSLRSAAGTALRVRMSRLGADGLALTLTEPVTGALVASVESLTVRPVDPAAFHRAGAAVPLYGLDWVTVARSASEPVRLAAIGTLPQVPSGLSLDVHPDLETLAGKTADAPPTDVLLVLPTEADTDHGPDPVAAAHRTAKAVLTAVQDFVADDRLAGSRLVVVTRGAVAARPGDDVPAPAGSPAWGLVRAALSEHPGRFVLVDHDGSDASWLALPTALAVEEEQFALRAGQLLAPRLAAFGASGATAEPSPLDPDGTVLITGGTGTLGTLLAKHLATTHGVRHLVLTSRRGPDAPGATQLTAELRERGATVTIAACDTTDRQAVDTLLAGIPTQHPLTAVIHTAGILDDATLATLTPERLTTVLRPKIDAAWHLHQATEHLDLRAFVLYSSIAATIGSPGQANYAAANAYLDALATHRHTHGLPAHSLAWGLWAQPGGMAGTLDTQDQARLRRSGIAPMSAGYALALFDRALRTDRPVLVPARVDTAALRSAETVPPLFRSLVRPAAHAVTGSARTADEPVLRERLAVLGAAERLDALLDLARTRIAEILGHDSPRAIGPDRGLMDLGFDSLMAVELRNSLGRLTGLRLPSTFVFDYPTPVAMAHELDSRLGLGDGGGADDGAETADEATIRQALAAIPLDVLRASGLIEPLLRLGRTAEPAPAPEDRSASIQEADTDELIRMAFAGLG
ncbi:type I polyketide synthase, partial [Kitasatospora sp. NPDC059648]|uniref:type I polyketide synthase n=1 Tax=Kitasatospora sp. NPDC059648 TaxID=3346894 RepID=UPI00367EC5A6